jgi:hypothetical protein
VYLGMKQKPPVFKEDGFTVLGLQHLGRRSSEENYHRWQQAIGFQVEFVLFDVAENDLPITGVAMLVRGMHQQGRNLEFRLQNATQNPRLDQDGSWIRGMDFLPEVVQFHGVSSNGWSRRFAGRHL